jgi:predicted DNA-binding protein (UPF0251 family)
MPRPKKPRFVSSHPTITAFIPQGVSVSGEVSLSVEGLESIRLSDFEHLDQEAAANLMKVSRQTYGRILASARSVVGEALVTGKALQVEGGTYQMRGRGKHRRRGMAHKISTIEEKHEKGGNIMPRDDGRWPQGQGSRQGRGRGRCNPNNSQQTLSEHRRMGSGRGQGPGVDSDRGRSKWGQRRRQQKLTNT